jgi:hypothetical protein
MNARTCLLCGKALSRIWVGAGEDFCSREHRNQYRLRKGMDRLLEANKVANLMRRREQPKPISPLQQAGNSNARIQDGARLTVQGLTKKYPPPIRWTPPFNTPVQRGAVAPVWHNGIAPPRQKEYGILKQTSMRLIVSSKASRRIEPPGAKYLDRTRQPQAVPTTARHGSALRVSANAGFRVPVKRGRHLPTPRHSGAGMQWPDSPLTHELNSMDSPAAKRMASTRFRPPAKHDPHVPEPDHDLGIVWPEAVAPGHRDPAVSAVLGPRGWGSVWSKGEAAPPRPIHYLEPKCAPAPLVGVFSSVAFGSPNPQVATVPWTPPENSPLGRAARGSAERYNPPPTGKLEENFDNGFKQWLGGTMDWVVDAAGVRTGSLALFRPSLGLRDYEVEFLARIENQSVTWVFRAASLSEYYIASIGVAPGGGYEFWRGSVMGGVAEPDVAVPLANPPSPKTAVNVRMTAIGGDFAVWLDGQKIDGWSDNRLSVGGIGFTGAQDDRARIYWVKISPAGAPAKE